MEKLQGRENADLGEVRQASTVFTTGGRELVKGSEVYSVQHLRFGLPSFSIAVGFGKKFLTSAGLSPGW